MQTCYAATKHPYPIPETNRHITFVIQGYRVYPQTPEECVKFIADRYLEAHPDYIGIFQNIQFHGFYGPELQYIFEVLKNKFPEKKPWRHSARINNVSESGKFLAAFIHPLADKVRES